MTWRKIRGGTEIQPDQPALGASFNFVLQYFWHDRVHMKRRFRVFIDGAGNDWSASTELHVDVDGRGSTIPEAIRELQRQLAALFLAGEDDLSDPTTRARSRTLSRYLEHRESGDNRRTI